MHGYKIFLHEQPDGKIIIHHDADIHDHTRICGQIQPQGKIAQWIHLRIGN